MPNSPSAQPSPGPSGVAAAPRTLPIGDRREGVRVRVPAKLNLHLGVGPRRDDGFHELITVFHAVGLFDTVTLTPARRMSLTVTGEGVGSVPMDETNLAWRAVEALARMHGIVARVDIRIDKAIPVAAGLAGGSADGAAALVAADALWGRRTSRTALRELAAGLGSDVAFGLLGGTAVGTGRGEILSPVLGGPERLWWVLALDEGGLSTPAVYAEFDRQADPGPSPLTQPVELLRALRVSEPRAVASALRNDLQPAALTLAPHLADTLRVGHELGALGSVLAGSGPTCVFLAADADAATPLASGLTAAGVCRTTRVVAGPAAGAARW